MKLLCASSLFLWSLLVFGVPQTTAADRPVELTLQGSFNFGEVDGFLQTPAGGEPGTSSRRRPSLHELDIDDAAFYDAQLGIRWRRLRLHAGTQFVRLDGSGILPRSFVSRGTSFAAGDRFTTDNHMDWYRLGAGWQLDLNHRLQFVPKVELVLLDFSYDLATSAESVSRDYAKAGVRLGFSGAYTISRSISLSLDAGVSLPVSNTPQIVTAISSVHFAPFRPRAGVRPEFFVGVGFQRIDYEDNQRLPNHIRADFGPFATAGVAVSF